MITNMRTLLELFEEGGGKLPFFAMHGGTVYRIEQARSCGAADNEFLCYFPNDTHGDWRKDSPTWQPYIDTSERVYIMSDRELLEKCCGILEDIKNTVKEIKGNITE